MKTFILLILSILSTLSFARAQTSPTNNNSTITGPSATFFDSVIGYFSSINTNFDSTFASSKCEITLGSAYANNVNTASTLNFEYKLGGAFVLDAGCDNAGIAGTLLSAQAGIGVYRVVHDIELSAFVDGGYDFSINHPFVEPRVEVKKALTPNTFAGVSLGSRFFIQKPTSGNAITPTLALFVGFVF